MKKKIFLSAIFSICCALMFYSCDNHEMPRYAKFSAYEYSKLDEDGGTWQPILLSSGAQIEIASPADINSDEYQGELASLKSLQSNLSSKQREAVTYWTNNPMVRWNEIALELAAKYNLIPGPNADGTYTLPNPATPEGPTPFPFAHPAYTSRALAYLSVAQFDAMITAWNYKYQFNRLSPSRVSQLGRTRRDVETGYE